MESNYLQSRRQQKLGLSEPKKKEPYRIPKRSKKMEKNMRIIKPMYDAFLALPENELCKIKMKGCEGLATVVHHMKGRIGELLFDQRYWLACCPKCNLAVEEKDKQAREQGFKLSQHSKN